MARVELNIVALGDFKSVNSQIKALQDQVNLLNKSVASVGVNANLTKQLNEANAAFKATILSTGQFTASTVRLKAETDKFGEALVGGKLKLTQYFQIIKAGTANATAQMKALAMEQTKLQNSMVMSDPTKQGVLSVFTPTKINAVTNATKIAANTQNLYNIAVDKGTQSLINWGKNTQWAGRQLTVGMTVPLTIFGTTAMKVFKEVNDEIVRLQKVYGTGIQQPTQAALAAIKDDVLKLSKELAAGMGIAVKDTAAMAADLAATGLQGNDLIGATRESIRLQKLGEMDQQDAMQTTISLQNVYKLSTNQLSGAIDFLNAVENQTSTSMQDLAAGIPKVGPIVQQLGGSFQDTALMMVAMKEAGVPAAQSANAIKSALASLINPTRAAKDAFAAYNINLSSIASKTGGNPVQMIMMLQDALKGLAPLAQAQLIDKLFGKYQQARIQALISNLGSATSQTRQAFDLMNASEAQLKGIAAGELKVATESTTGKFRRAVETMKADLLPVGEKIMQVATTLLNFGNSVAKVFGGLPGPVKTVLGIVAAGVALSGPIIMFTGVLANFVGYLIKGLFSMKDLINGTKTFGQLFTPEIIASQNAAQLFSQKILQDESAVMLLNKAVRELTISLEGMAMGMAAASGTSLGTKLLAAEAGLAGGRIPFKAPKKMATGGYIPGNPGDGDVYPALLQGGEAVIPTEQAQQYSPFINAMLGGKLPGFHGGVEGFSPGGTPQYKPSGGNSFVMQETIRKNQEFAAAQEAAKAQIASRNLVAGHAAMPFTPDSPQYQAMMAKYPSLPGLEASNPGSVKVVSNLVNTAMDQRLNTDLRSGIATKERFAAGFGAEGKLGFARSAIAGGMGEDQLTNPEIQRALKDFESELKNRVLALKESKISDEHLAKETRKLIEEQRKAAGATGEVARALHASSQQVGQVRVNPGADYVRSGLQSGKLRQSGTMAYLNEVPVGQVRTKTGAVTDYAINQPGGYQSSGVAVKKSMSALEKSLAKELDVVSESASPSRATKRAAKNMVDGVTLGIKESKPAVKAAANIAMEEALLASAGGGEYTNLATETEPGLAATSRSGGRFARLNASRMAARAKLQSRMPSIMTGRFSGIGMGLGLQMAQQFGGQYVDKLPGGSIANSAISGASMGAFLGPEAAVAGAALGTLAGVIKKTAEEVRIGSNALQSSFSVTAVAAQHFGLQANSLSQFDFSTTLKNVKDHASSIAENKAAVDKLTLAYMNASDQMTQDYLNRVKGASGPELAKLMQEKYATNVAAGLGPVKDAKTGIITDKAKEDVIAIMKAAGRSGIAQNEALSKLPNYGTGSQATSKGFVGALQQAANNKPSMSFMESLGAYFKSGTAEGAVQDAKNKAVGLAMTNVATTLPSNVKAAISGLSPVVVTEVNKSKIAFQSWMGQLKKDAPTLAAYLDKAHTQGTSTMDLFKAVSLLNSGIVKTPEALDKILKKAGALDALFNSKEAQSYTGIPTVTNNPNLHADGSPLTAEEIAANKASALQKKYKSILDLDQKRITALERQKKLMDDQNSAAQDAIGYATQQTDVQNQIRKAMAGGDYLQANLLRQQLAGNADKYNQTVISNQNTATIDKGRQLVADAQAKLASGKDLTKAEIKALKDYNPKLGTYQVGSVNMPSAVQYGTAASLGTGVSSAPVVNMVFNDTGKFTQEQLQSIVDNAFKKNGVTAKMSGTGTKVGG